MIPIALCLAMSPVIGLPADLGATMALSDTSQATLRPAYVRSGDALDLTTAPSASVTFDLHRHALFFGYNPSFTVRDVFDASNRLTLLLHTGIVSYSYSTGRYRLALTESGSIGYQTFTSLTPTSPADPRMLPDPTMSRILLSPGVQDQKISVVSEATTGTFDYRWSPRWDSLLSASYAIAGGLGSDAATIPRQTSETFGASAVYTASKRNVFVTAWITNHTKVSNGYEYWSAQLSEAWQHALTPHLSFALTAGVEEVWQRDPNGQSTTTFYPFGSAGLTGALYLLQRRHLTISLVLGSSYRPAINPITGQLQGWLQGSSTLLVASDRTTLATTLDAAQTFPVDDADEARIFGAGVVATHAPGKLISFSAGYRSVWQQSNNPTLDSLPRQWILFVGMTINAPPMKF